MGFSYSFPFDFWTFLALFLQDLKGIISYLRRQVLRDCTIVLSGIVPVGVDAVKTEAYRLCVQFGAAVVENVTNATTHVVAARWGTS